MNREEIVITDVKELNLANDIIHDSFFDVDDIYYDNSKKEVSIPFELKEFFPALGHKNKLLFLKPYRKHITSVRIIFGNVDELIIIDSERVGLYDFNILSWDANKKQLTIKTGIPIKIHMRISNLNIRIEFSETKQTEKILYRPW